MTTPLTLTTPVGRALLASVFLLSGITKLGAFTATQSFMESVGVPGVLLAPTIAFEIIAALAIIVGFHARSAAFLLAGFSLLTALLFHFNFADQIQTILFLKNISIAGGLLILVGAGPGSYSLNARQ
ncbi:MAG: DoxX family protein [Pseudomonadota bacterium]